MKKALILPAWKEPFDGNWYSWLKTELEKKGYQVYLPDLPTMQDDFPDMKKQIDFVDNLMTFDENAVVIGHSLGSLLALRLLEKRKAAKLILISYWDKDEPESVPGHKSFWGNPIDHVAINKNTSEIVCIASDNDPWVGLDEAKAVAQRFNAKFILVPGGNHFTMDRGNYTFLPEILEFV